MESDRRRVFGSALTLGGLRRERWSWRGVLPSHLLSAATATASSAQRRGRPRATGSLDSTSNLQTTSALQTYLTVVSYLEKGTLYFPTPQTIKKIWLYF